MKISSRDGVSVPKFRAVSRLQVWQSAVSGAIRCPLSSSITRSQSASASVISWVEQDRGVGYPATRSRSAARQSFERGSSRPVAGSSSRSSFRRGEQLPRRMMATFCCTASGRVDASGFIQLAARHPSAHSLRRSSPHAPSGPERPYRRNAPVFRWRKLEERGLHGDTRLISRFTSASSCWTSKPKTSTVPSSGINSVESMRINVTCRSHSRRESRRSRRAAR